MIAIALALQLLVDPVPADSMPGATPAASGAPRFVQVLSLTGVPADTTIRAEFESAFLATFAEDELPGERLSGAGEWKGGLPLPNRFRLLQGDEAGDAWKVDVTIGAPPPMAGTRDGSDPITGKATTVRTVVGTHRASRGMIVAWSVQVPGPSGAIARTATGRAAFYYPATGAAGATLAVPETRYRFPWRNSGRIAATLVLESLQRESGDLLDSERFTLTPAVRSEAGR